MAGKIFINYRRDDSIGMAGRLHDRLAHTFGRAKLFMDVDHIPVGTDFVAHLNSQVAECDDILVVIGPNWLGVKDESGRRRLDDPDDFVAIEIAAAYPRHSCHPSLGRWGTHAEGKRVAGFLEAARPASCRRRPSRAFWP